MSAQVDTTYNVTGLTRNSDEDFTVNVGNAALRGWCFWDEYWRSIRYDTGEVNAFSPVDGSPVPAENFTLDNPGSDRYNGLTTDGTNLIVLDERHPDNDAEMLIVNTSHDIVNRYDLARPTGSNGATGGIAFDSDMNQVWVSWSVAVGSTVDIQNYDIDGTVLNGHFNGITGHRSFSGMVIWNGIVIGAYDGTDRFYAYRLSDGMNISGVNNTTTSSIQGVGQRNNIVFAADLNNSVDAFNINFTKDVAVSASDSVVAVTDTIAKLGVFTRAVSDDIAGTTDTISADKDLTIPVSDVILAITDTIEKRLGREITDTITGVTDTVTATDVTKNKSVSDSILAVTDNITKSQGYLRTLDDSIAESLGDPVSIGSISSAFVTNRGMTFWPDENVLFVSYVFASNSNIIIIRYDPTTHTFTVTDTTSYELLGTSISALAFIPSESKLLVATTSNIRQVDATPDEDNGAALAENAITLTAPDGLSTPIQSMTYHPASGRLLVGVVGTTRRIFDFLYDAANAELTDKRELTGDYTTGDNIRSITLHGDTLVMSNIDEDEIQAYDYDSVAGTLNNERTLREEDNINATTFAGDQYLLIKDQTIYRHQYVAPSSGDISITDAITRMSTHIRSLVDSISITGMLSTGSGLIKSLSDSLSITDTITRLQSRTKSITDSLSITDTIKRIQSRTKSLADSLSTSDTLSSLGIATKFIFDSLPTSDSLSRLQTRTLSLADSLLISDAITRAKGIIIQLTEGGGTAETTEESISDPEDVATINADRIPIRGMAYHAATNNVYSAYKDGNEDQILSRTYTNRVLNATFVSRFVALTTFTPTSIAIAGNKLLIALNASTNPLDAIHDFTISSTGALSAQRELRVEDIPRAVHGMAVHIPSGKVIFTDPPDNRVWDYDYDPDAASDEDHLSNKRGILDENVRLNPRTITFHGDIAIIGDTQSGKVHRYTYDPVAGTLTEEADLFTEAGVSASTMVDNDYLYGVSGGSEIRRRVFTPAAMVTGGVISISDALTKSRDYTKSLSDSLSISDALTKIQTLTKSLADSLSISDAISTSTAPIKNLTDSLSISDSLTRLQTRTKSLGRLFVNLRYHHTYANPNQIPEWTVYPSQTSDIYLDCPDKTSH